MFYLKKKKKEKENEIDPPCISEIVWIKQF